MKGKGLLKRVFSVAMALVLVVGLITVSEPTSAQAEDSEWQLVPSDHTPASGVELPTNVKNLVSAYGDFSSTVSIATTTGTVTQEDGMLVFEEGSNAQIPVGNVTGGTTYVASFYVWATGDSVLFDVDFDGAGSPNNHATANYVDDVMASWQTNSLYTLVNSCTLDGVKTTSSLNIATDGWKKVVIEWTPDNTSASAVYLNLGGFSTTKGTVAGTVYIDDLSVYAKPKELETTLNFYKDIAGQFAFNNFNSELTSYTGTYTGPVMINGVETIVTCHLTSSLFHTSVLTALNNKEVKSIAIATDAKFVRNDGSVAITVTQGITCTPPASYTTDSYEADRTNWTSVYDKEEITMSAKYNAVLSDTQIGYSITSTGGAYVNTDYVSGGGKRGWYSCTIAIGGVDTTIQVFLGDDNANDAADMNVLRFGNTEALTTAIANGTTMTFPATMELAKNNYIIKVDLGEEHNLKYQDGSWVVLPADHTPTTGVEVPTNATTYIKESYADSTALRTEDTASVDDGMLLLGDSKYASKIMYSNSAVVKDTVYVTTFYVWTVGNDTVFDVFFDAGGSPTGNASGTLADNVLKKWSTTHGAYITSCTVDGIATTDSLRGATGGWKKVEIEWKAKATDNVLIIVGDYKGNTDVTGTIYVDDFVTYKKPSTIMYTDYGFYPLGSQSVMALDNISSSDIKALTGEKYAGTIEVDGIETSITLTEGNGNLVINGCTQDSGTTLFFEKDSMFISTDGTKAVVLNHDLSYTKTGDGYGSTAWTKNAIAFTTDIALYKITDSMTAYTYTADLPASFPNASTFTGNITVNGTTKSVTWTLSDACLIPAGVKDDGSTTSIEVKPGTVLTGTYGTITIENGLKYAKNEDTSVSISTPIGWYKVSDAGQILFNGIDTTALSAYVEDTYTGAILLNGTSHDVTWRVDSNLLVVTNNIANYGDITSIEVTNGTVLTSTDGSGDTITLTNGIDYVKINGTWYQDTNRAEVTLSYTFEKVNTTTNQVLYKIDEATDLDDEGTTNSARGWKTVTVQVGGVDTPVQMFFADSYCTFGNQGASSDVIVTAVQNGTSITIPATLTLVTDTHVITLNFTTLQNIEKLGEGWGMYTEEHEYENDNNTRYYNIDNGTVYTITSSNDVVTVAEDDKLSTGDTISEVGTYNISRIETQEKWNEKVVLYKHGDVDESNAVTSKDLVALKKEIAQTGDADLAGKQAADMDGNGNIEAIDAKALRYEVAKAETVIDDAAAEKVTHSIEVSKADSVLNGEMLIGGFAAPIAKEYSDLSTAYELIAGTGINTITYCEDPYYQNGTTDYADQHLELAAKQGLKMYVRDTSAENNTFDADNFATRVGAYSMYESFVGLQIVDEPGYGSTFVHSDGTRNIDSYKTTIELCKNAANISGFVNLFPYYQDTWGTGKETEYQSYIQGTFTDTDAEMLSVDHYAVKLYPSNSTIGAWFGWDEDTKATNTYDFYQNLEVMRKNVSDTNKPFWYVAQAGTILPAEDAATTFDSSLYATGEETQWQINTALAMGARGIQYWQLFQSAYYSGSVETNCSRSGLIGNNGNKNEEYYNAAIEQNAFIKVVDEVLMNAENEGVVTNDTNAQNGLTIEINSYNELSGVTGSNALVGCFNYYGKTVLYVVNCNTSSSQNITLNFNKSCDAYVTGWSATEVNRTNATTGTSVTVNVGAGQSALVIIE